MVPVSRRSFYRSLKEQQPVEEEMEVRSAIQQIALEHRRRYGYRRITAELHRREMQVNHKRVARIMREDNLLGMQPERFVVTTNSNHKLEIYLNLASRMKLTGINQLWVADITYVRLKAEFVYLAVILDGFSRRVVGWALDRTLAIRLTIGALGNPSCVPAVRDWIAPVPNAAFPTSLCSNSRRRFSCDRVLFHFSCVQGEFILVSDDRSR
jgi:putative transposase